MKRYSTTLTIAGSDSGGGAGIQADLKTISAIGVYAATAITAVTAQNTVGVTDIHPLPPYMVRAQIEAVLSDIGADAIKIGMLHDTVLVEVVAEMLDKYNPAYVVLDPVMIATSGDKLITPDTVEAIASQLFARATIVTPNIDEAELLSGIKITTLADMHLAAQRMLERGCQAVLMKGGHLGGEEMTDMLFVKGKEPIAYTEKAIKSRNTHGTGCTLSSAIAAYLALGNTLEQSVALAKKFITNAIAAATDVAIGAGHGSLNHYFAPVPLAKFGIEKD